MTEGCFFEDLSVGQKASFGKTVTEADIVLFAAVSGDTNPMHLNAEYAKDTIFGERIAHGMLAAGLITKVMGTQLPGPGTIYLSQSLKFIKPVKPGDTITARAEVVEVLRERNRVRLHTVCTNQRGEEVLSGEAWVMPTRTHVTYEGPARLPIPAAIALQPWAWTARAVAMWGTVSLAMLRGFARRS